MRLTQVGFTSHCSWEELKSRRAQGLEWRVLLWALGVPFKVDSCLGSRRGPWTMGQ